MIVNESALMSVWQRDGFDLNGPTLSSLLGIVRVKGVPCWDVNVMLISAGRELIRLHAIP